MGHGWYQYDGSLKRALQLLARPTQYYHENGITRMSNHHTQENCYVLKDYELDASHRLESNPHNYGLSSSLLDMNVEKRTKRGIGKWYVLFVYI